MRIASLLPSATEICFAIGAGDEVVAVTHECDFPDAARRLPAITADALANADRDSATIDRHIREARHQGSAIYHLDARRLAELEPDLILTQELCDVCAVGYRDVEAAVRTMPGGVPILSLEPTSVGQVIDTIVAVGRASGHAAEAGDLAGELRTRIAAVGTGPHRLPPPRVVCLEWTDPLMIGGHWVPEMVELAGGIDCLGTRGTPSRDVPWAAIEAAAPDLLVLMPCGFGLEETLRRSGEVTGRPGFTALPCARSGRVVAVDGSSYYNRPGPRIADGVEILAAVIDAEPGDPLPAGAAWIS
jgi:iron complex transport system substrate-binding protein